MKNILLINNKDKIYDFIESESMKKYLSENDSNFTLMYKSITHSDLITAGKKNERQGFDKNLLYYLKGSEMEELFSNDEKFPTAHQSNISVDNKIFELLNFTYDRGDEQVKLDEIANIYLVNDSLKYFNSKYTKEIFTKLEKDCNWDFTKYDVDLNEDSDFTKILLSYASHGIGTERDTEFHKLRRHIFKADNILLLFENKDNIKPNLFIMLNKNPIFKKIVDENSDVWLKSELKDLNTKVHDTFVIRQTENDDNRIVTRSGQEKWRKNLADEMKNYNLENKVFCPITLLKIDDFQYMGTIFRASHIKAFADCDDAEKYDLDNGLLLSANVDALFDKHLFTINPDGTFRFSKAFNDELLQSQILKNDRIFKNIYNEKRKKYMLDHNKKFDEKEEKRKKGIDVGDSLDEALQNGVQ